MNTTIELRPGYGTSRIIRGCWQLAGGHGPVDIDEAIVTMIAFVDSGITTFDCADHYIGVEELLGSFLAKVRAQRGAAAAEAIQIHTKFVPDRDVLGSLDRRYTETVIDRSLRRLGVERLDLVQFHWWDFDVPGFVEAAATLADLQRAGKIRHIGTTNFDVAHLAQLVDGGIPVLANQVQFSVVDGRPAGAMTEFCRAHDIHLLCYGVLAGGFISADYLAVDEPDEPLANRSLTKYRLIIEEAGGWQSFQRLLQALDEIAHRRDVALATVAARWTLEQPAVAGVITGARSSARIPSLRHVLNTALTAEDRADLDQARAQLRSLRGDVYELEREKGGRHAAIMRYNQNAIEGSPRA